MARYFNGLAEFARHLAECELRAIPTPGMAAEASKDVLYDHAQKIYGDVTKLAPLAQSTQDERLRLGYSPNEPLKRTGERLQAGLEKDSNAEGLAGIGSPDIVAKAHELGFFNVHAKKMVPPRSTMRQAMSESIWEIRDIAAGVLSFALGQSKPTLKTSAESARTRLDQIVRRMT